MKPVGRLLCFAISAVALAVPTTAAGKAGDIIVGDFSGEVTRLAPDGSPTAVIATGPPLGGAYGLDFGPDAAYIANSGGTSGVYRILATSTTPETVVSGSPISNPLDMEFGADGAAYVAEDQLGVVRVDVGANSASEYAADPIFQNPLALTVAPDMTIFVSDLDRVLRVDPANQDVTVAATIFDSALPGTPNLNGIERSPSGLLYAYDYGEGRLVRVDPRTGAVSTVASGDNLTADVYNIAIEPAGTLVMANYDIDRIVRVNPVSGAQTLIPGTFTDMEGIAVEPPRCRGKLATMVGSTRPDVIRGSRFGDVIAALGGRDKVLGLGGKDIVCGGTGPDRLLGGAGADVLLGGPGRDRLVGGKGRDHLLGGKGHDTLVGGPGHDRQRQ